MYPWLFVSVWRDVLVKWYAYTWCFGANIEKMAVFGFQFENFLIQFKNVLISTLKLLKFISYHKYFLMLLLL